MKRIYFFTLLMLVFSMSHAQEVISSNGEHNSNSGFQITSTIGELVIQTQICDGIQLTQGFNQPILTINNILDLGNQFQIKMYPNPANEFVIIEYHSSSESLKYELYNQLGQLITKNWIQGIITKLDLRTLSSSTYFLKIYDQKNQKKKVYQILKSK